MCMLTCPPLPCEIVLAVTANTAASVPVHVLGVSSGMGLPCEDASCPHLYQVVLVWLRPVSLQTYQLLVLENFK